MQLSRHCIVCNKSCIQSHSLPSKVETQLDFVYSLVYGPENHLSNSRWAPICIKWPINIHAWIFLKVSIYFVNLTLLSYILCTHVGRQFIYNFTINLYSYVFCYFSCRSLCIGGLQNYLASCCSRNLNIGELSFFWMCLYLLSTDFELRLINVRPS